MRQQTKKKALNWSIGVLLLLILVGAIAYQQGFALVPAGNTVWIPDYGTLACKQTRLECFPGTCSDTNPEFKTVTQTGESIWCGAPTISNANYYEGCKVYVNVGAGVSFSTMSVCNGDGTQCQTVNGISDTSRYGGLGGSTKRVDLRSGQKLYINPNLVTMRYHIDAPVYGIAIEGAVKPKYADRCNVAQLLTDKQIATLKNSPDYAKTIAAGEINPGEFPVVFIVGYRASYSDQRVIERSGDSWFIEDIGTRCKIEQDTNGRYLVTDNCVEDTTIQCFPNIGNCDSEGRILAVTGEDALDQKACVPGTLIGSSTSRVPISSTEACKLRCDSTGVPQNFDCVEIKKCTDGKVLSQNYDCVAATTADEKSLCEAGGGKFTTTKDEDGKTVTSCDYSKDDYFLLWIGLAVVVIILLMIVVKMRMDAGKRR